jgi:hypothetical protein
MKIYFAGAESCATSDKFRPYDKSLKSQGVKRRLMNAFYMDYKLCDAIKTNVWEDLIIDSGGLQIRCNEKEVSLEDYARFLNLNKVKIAFNLDTRSWSESESNWRYLQHACPNTYIIPIYHAGEYENPKTRDVLYDLVRDFLTLR